MRTRRTLGAARPRAALNSSRIEIRPCFDQNKAVGTRRTLGAGVHARREAIAERGRDTAEIRRPGGPAGRASSHLRRGREGCGAATDSRRRTRGDGMRGSPYKDRLRSTSSTWDEIHASRGDGMRGSPRPGTRRSVGPRSIGGGGGGGAKLGGAVRPAGQTLIARQQRLGDSASGAGARAGLSGGEHLAGGRERAKGQEGGRPT